MTYLSDTVGTNQDNPLSSHNVHFRGSNIAQHELNNPISWVGILIEISHFHWVLNTESIIYSSLARNPIQNLDHYLRDSSVATVNVGEKTRYISSQLLNEFEYLLCDFRFYLNEFIDLLHEFRVHLNDFTGSLHDFRPRLNMFSQPLRFHSCGCFQRSVPTPATGR